MSIHYRPSVLSMKHYNTLKIKAFKVLKIFIDLCLSLYPWAIFRSRKGPIKLHTLIDLRGNILALGIITHGIVHKVTIPDELIIEAGAIYIMDRGYLDLGRLYRPHQSLAFFVTLAKSNFKFRRLYSNKVDKTIS